MHGFISQKKMNCAKSFEAGETEISCFRYMNCARMCRVETENRREWSLRLQRTLVNVNYSKQINKLKSFINLLKLKQNIIEVARC